MGSPAGFPFYLVEVQVKPTAEFNKIKHLQKGVSETDKTVRAALLSERLFEFGELHIQTIGGQL